MTQPLPSATVVPLRETRGQLEVLMTRRPDEFRFMAGLWVFPGGRVDEADLAAAGTNLPEISAQGRSPSWLHSLCAASGAALPARESLAYGIAACRELEEEVGLHAAPDRLVYFGHWITPAGGERRFETRFFLAAHSHGEDLRVDPRESAAHGWFAPEEVLAAQARGEMPAAPPTLMTLHDLAVCHRMHGSVQALLAAESARRVVALEPHLHREGETVTALMPWAAAAESPAGAAFPEYLLRLPDRIVLPRSSTVLRG